ncbi:MAG: TRAP transporter large permease subunit, partial [Pseudomonadota bacterium]
MDIGTISLVLLLAMLVLLAIGMPLGFASAILAVLVLVMKFEPALLSNPFAFGDGLLTRQFGTGPLNILAQRVYGLLTDYVLISIPLFIFMASLLERSGIAQDMYESLNTWLSGVRGGIALVTSVMAVIMAAMSGIIGGEVVLLGLIALPQMLRLGYNQNLAIGTICASGSLGTMIPPSIVLIIYGLITETSIKALFTASFLPGFMLASFFMVYIVVRTQLRPEDAPLPAPIPGEPQGREKGVLFATFLTTLAAGLFVVLFVRAAFFTATGMNAFEEGVDPIAYGTADYLPWFGGFVVGALALLFLLGRKRLAKSWSMGKGLVAPIIVIGVVLGSIYGGITGITEAAGMGVVAVFVLSVLRGEASVGLVWDSLMRTLKSTGTIIWVTIG